ncbi:MAG: HAD family hydrolase [Defluviitaleaceae bacterium]|nr:HAD family hydrolase [Defluviitaleaceae bacterium]
MREIKKPEMVIFDFGGTLMSEEFDLRRGTAAVMKVASKIPEGVTLETVLELDARLWRELEYCPKCGHSRVVEIQNACYERYLYEYFGIEFDIPYAEVEEIFQRNVSVSKPTPNIGKLLDFLYAKGIRTALISNISYSGQILERWVNEIVPNNHFEFIIATSEYLFKKPSPRIFELALRKARLAAEQAWYCGNSGYNDIDGSHAAGLFPVWYKGAEWFEDGCRPEYDYLEISDWEEMIGILN